MERPNKSNLIAIDVARAIASLSVFFYHLHLGGLLTKYTKLHFFVYFDFFGATYSVPLFFLISGYCIHLSNLKYIKTGSPLPVLIYFKRRFWRIFPPYLLALAFPILSNRITNYVPNSNMYDIFVHIFCLQGYTTNYFNTVNLVFWTISIEIAFYVLYPLFYYVRLRFNLPTAMISVFIISLSSIVYFSFQKNTSNPQFYFVGNIWLAWCSGAYLADKLFFEPMAFNKLKFKLLYVLFLLFAIVLHHFKSQSFLLIHYQFKILVWTGPLVYILSKELWLKQQESLLLNLLIYCGLSSYSLYLLHEPLIFLKNYIVKVIVPPYLSQLAFVIGVFIVPIIAWLNYRYVEKPFINISTKLKSKPAHFSKPIGN